METRATELRSVIDAITLAVADRAENDLATKIADEAIVYIDQLRRDQRMLTEQSPLNRGARIALQLAESVSQT